jgi:adenylate cyclase
MFCDLRGFSGISERLEPRALARVINIFFSTVTEAVLARGGTVDKYMGDAVMAFWNAPLDQPDHAARACRAALDIVAGIERLNAREHFAGLCLDCGIGINTGLCTVGNFGSRYRFDYSAVGDAVNVAARLETETKTFGLRIALGPATAARVPELATLPLGPIRLRGRDQDLELWTLIGDETLAQSPRFAALRERHEALRSARQAEDWAGARTRLAELEQAAPPDLAPLYRHLEARLRR